MLVPALLRANFLLIQLVTPGCPACDHSGRDRRRRIEKLGKTADRVLVARRVRLRAIPRRHLAELRRQEHPLADSDPERAKPLTDRRDSTNFHYALPAMARYLCAELAWHRPARRLFAYNHADWYVAEVVQIAARYGGVGASGGGLIDGWADRPPLNQYDRRNDRSDQSWLAWRDADCSAAALAARRLRSNRQQPRRRHRSGRTRHRHLHQSGSSSTRGSTGLPAHGWGALVWQGPLGYDQNGMYTRDSSGWDTRYLTWSRSTARSASAGGSSAWADARRRSSCRV